MQKNTFHASSGNPSPVHTHKYTHAHESKGDYRERKETTANRSAALYTFTNTKEAFQYIVILHACYNSAQFNTRATKHGHPLSQRRTFLSVFSPFSFSSVSLSDSLFSSVTIKKRKETE